MNNNIQQQNSRIWAIILAAGESKRMNSPKLLLPFRGRTIIETVILNVENSRIKNIMVVLGSSREEMIRTIGDMDINTCYNASYKEGMLSSVKCGLSSLPDDFAAVVVIQGDQPMIPYSVIDSLVSAWNNSSKGIIIPVHKKMRGHPILIDSKYRGEIEMLESDEGLHALSIKFASDVFEIEAGSPDILRDIDTREDYLKEINQT